MTDFFLGRESMLFLYFRTVGRNFAAQLAINLDCVGHGVFYKQRRVQNTGQSAK